MINLLPPSLKDSFRKEQQMRFFWILCVLAGLFFICVFLLFLSLHIYLQGAVDAQNILLETYKQNTLAESALKEEIRNLNKSLGHTISFYQAQPKASLLISRVASLIPEGTHLTFFQYIPSSTIASDQETKIMPAKIILSGFSPGRSDLLLFRESLQKEPSFREFDFPPANWAKPSDILFSFSFEVSGI